MALLNRLANGLVGVGRLIVLLFVLWVGTVGLLFGNSFFFVVQPGEIAIKFNRIRGGVKKETYAEGIHFRVPLMENIIKYDVRIKPVDISSHTSTKDQQQIDITLRVLYKPVEADIANIHLNLGANYQERFVRPIALEVIKTVLAQYDADQLLKQREKISSEIKALYTTRIKEYHLTIEDVTLTDLNFSLSYKNAIEAKQISQQMAEKGKYVVEMNEQLFKANLIEIEARSQAMKLVNEAQKNYGDAYLRLKKLEAARKIAENLTHNPNIVFVPNGNSFLFQV